MRTLTDCILEEHGDLIKEIPEAEQAIHDYRVLRRRQAMAAALASMQAKTEETRRLAWEGLLCQRRSSRPTDPVDE